MATKSILKDVRIKDSTSAYRIVRAMEKASNNKTERVQISRPVSSASKDEIRAMFGATK